MIKHECLANFDHHTINLLSGTSRALALYHGTKKPVNAAATDFQYLDQKHWSLQFLQRPTPSAAAGTEFPYYTLSTLQSITCMLSPAS
jgi:hypothetical protein